MKLLRASAQHVLLPWRRAGPLSSTPASTRHLSSTPARRELKPIDELPARVHPSYIPSPANTLLSLHWSSPPRNILITKKQRTPNITESVIQFAKHITSTYPAINVIFSPESAAELHQQLPFPVYTHDRNAGVPQHLSDKTDLVCTLGGDGTLLRASSLFSHSGHVPPVLSFAMGTIGFLGEFKFEEYKRAFAEVMGGTRSARILLRNRLKVGVFRPDGTRIGGMEDGGDTYALNEVTLHRGSSAHLKVIDVYINGRFLTEAVADGIIISSPTGSTAYSLSSGGSIVHPLVPSLLLTPICPRSLSFRPLVLPAETPITLRLGEKNRGREVEVSIDGHTITERMGVGMEVRVAGEEVRKMDQGWEGGVPSIVRGAMDRENITEDHWVGGLNALLKYNYPFGDQGP